ncbi:MAG TPA: long-chain-fatty-acid--CoA ligase [Candidatus Acidoferrales bacterium]|nr:long-chain-fatty-acid--CoA ligase [Candidatus Acidoferrales bacterium]
MNIPLTPIRFLRYAAQQFPGKTAVICGNERFTYSQFASRASRLAGALREMDVQPGDRVAYLSGNCHRLLEAYYGVLEAGAVLLPLNIRLTPNELAYILNDSGAKVLIFQEQFSPIVEGFRNELQSVRKFVGLDHAPSQSWAVQQRYENLIATAAPYRTDLMQVDENALAELFYTSGTSANPKGVMLTHRNIYLHALNVIVVFNTGPDTVELHTIPLFHANGWGVAHSVTLVGATHVMIGKFDPPEVFRLIEQEKVHACSLVPTMATALVNCPERPKYDLSSLKRITLGGAAASPTLVRQVEERIGCICFSGYGLTETCPVLTTAQVKAGVDWQDEERFEGQARTGYPLPGVEIRIVDADDLDVPHDGVSIGEIVARSDGVMAGYWKQPEATATVMRDGWFHTGDMATMDENGYVLIVDRKKDIIVSGGENISSLEVEKVMLAHPAVYEVAVIPVPDERWGEVPKAIVSLKPGMQLSESALMEFTRSRLSHYKCPRSIEFMEVLPKTGTGKILKKELRKKYWSGTESIRPEMASKK